MNEDRWPTGADIDPFSLPKHQNFRDCNVKKEKGEVMKKDEERAEKMRKKKWPEPVRCGECGEPIIKGEPHRCDKKFAF